MTAENEREVPVAIDGGTSSTSGVGGGVPTEAEMHAMIVVYAESQGMEISEADMALIEEEGDGAGVGTGTGTSTEVITQEEHEAQSAETFPEEEGWISEGEISDGEAAHINEEIAVQQEVQGDNMIQTEEDLVDAIVGGMYVQMYLMEQDQIELWDSLGGPTPADMAHDAGLLTQEQVDWVNAPFHTEAETIAIIEEGPVIQMFTEAELEEVGGEEYMVQQFLIDVGREDLEGNVIVLSDKEKQMIYDYRIGERGLEGTEYAKILDGAIRGTGSGGQLKELLDTIQGTNRDDTEAIADEEKDEREEWGCISGIKDKHTCGGCRSLIGTCGPMSELPNPPFHKGCRCGKYRA